VTLNLDDAALAAAATLLRRHGAPPALGVVLGSGLGAFADRLENAIAIPYAEIPHAPLSRVIGHAGSLVIGELGGVRMAVLSGRVHAYEGHSWERVTFLVRLLARWGIKGAVLTNAAGGINLSFTPGDLMLLTDHINLLGGSPLVGDNDERFGPRFLDMTHAYDPAYAAQFAVAAAQEKLTLQHGVYAAMLGPAYETPAEIRMLRALGADAVGMSTVPETLALRHLGVRVAALSCITNAAAGISGEALSHAEVKAVADRVADRFVRLLAATLPRLAAA
jgi:purine-nucleoside phosphorylase